jgi:hypothetical protein
MSYTMVTIPTNLIENIKKIIIETSLYRYPFEFIITPAREKVEKIHQLQVDRMKLEAFYMRE